MLQCFMITRVISQSGGNRLGVGFLSCSEPLVHSLSQGNWNDEAEVYNCLKLRDNSNLVPAGYDTSSNEKMDISKEERTEIPPPAEEKMDTAQEDDDGGVGDSSKVEKETGSADEHFQILASQSETDMPELQGWFVKSGYDISVAAFRNEFGFSEGSEINPLHVAAWRGLVDIVDKLIKEKKVDANTQAGGEGDFQGWTALHFAAHGNHEEMVYKLVTEYGADPNVQCNVYKDTPLHVASHFGCAGAMKGFLRAECESRHPLNVNATNINGHTALHIAAYKIDTSWPTDTHAEVVQTLLNFPDIKLTIEDGCGRTALDLASLCANWAVFDSLRLKITPEVTNYNEPYYKDRQASVDAANAILVSAAVIASATFAAWLQPPLSYSTYCNERCSNSFPAAPPTFDLDHPALSWFWIFNSFSFFMAIATIMAGAQSVLPSRRMSVKQEVAKLQRNLLITSTLLALSMVFVLLAFAIAGVMVVPPVFKRRASILMGWRCECVVFM
jgi:ankyrin repeat protein